MSNFIERVGPFAIFPVLHHSYEFAVASSEAFRELNPCGVGLEYPFALQDLILQGINRLPRVSLLTYGEKIRRYIRIEPVDAFIEAARLAISSNIPVRCLDLALEDYPDISESYPDTYAVQRIGHQAYCEMVLNKHHALRLELDEAAR